MTSTFRAAAGVVFSAAALAMAPVAGAAAPSASDQVLAVERAWNRAIAARDGAAVSALLSEEFVFVAPNGLIVGKAAMVRAASDRAYAIDPFDTIDPVVRLYGKTAVVTGSFTQKGSYDGKAFASSYAYTDVYVLRRGRWIAVSAHASLIAK